MVKAPPQLVIVSPIAFEDLSDKFDLPDGSAKMRIFHFMQMQ